jgi:hypothetical protein
MQGSQSATSIVSLWPSHAKPQADGIGAMLQRICDEFGNNDQCVVGGNR